MTQEKIFTDSGDSSSDLANKRKQFIEFFHVPTGLSVKFKAFITQFSDQYSSKWNDEELFGRMDPVSTFKGTGRIITLGWEVVAGSEEEAIENLQACSLLISMLYPDYNSKELGGIISTSPLFRLRFMNLIQNVISPGSSAKTGGLLGKLSGLTYEPNLEEGFFDPININSYDGEKVYPKALKLQCEYTVLHEHPLGWFKSQSRSNFDKFPYGNRKDSTTDSETNKTQLAGN